MCDTLQARTRTAFITGIVSLAAAVALLSLAFSSAFANGLLKCPATDSPNTLESTQPLNLGELKQQLSYYKCFHYDADIKSVLTQAQIYVEDQAAQVTKPALVLDIDETSLSNWLEIYHNDYGYIPEGPCDIDSKWACGSRAWDLSQSAEVIQPTLELFNAAKAKNVAIFFITGRTDDPEERVATEANLRKVGYDGWQGLVLRPPSSSGPVAPYKTSAREGIAAAGFTIIANVGDQHSDLDGGFANRVFKVPNPFYFLP
jgi:predicted secreted acid phosphatase